MSVAFAEPVLLHLKIEAGVVAFGRFAEQSSRNSSIIFLRTHQFVLLVLGGSSTNLS